MNSHLVESNGHFSTEARVTARNENKLFFDINFRSRYQSLYNIDCEKPDQNWNKPTCRCGAFRIHGASRVWSFCHATLLGIIFMHITHIWVITQRFLYARVQMQDILASTNSTATQDNAYQQPLTALLHSRLTNG